MENIEIVKAPPIPPPAGLEKAMKDLKAILTTEVGDFVWITPEQAEVIYNTLAYACAQAGFKVSE